MGIEMKDNATGNVRVSYFSSCLSDGPPRQTNKCSGLKVGTRVMFTAKIEVVKCPKDPREWKQTFQIYPVGINESVIVDLEMICQCNCEIPGNFGYEENSPLCNGVGTYKCGICECPPDFFGRKCECSAENLSFSGDLEAGCRPDNTTSTLCNNRGDCICGKCECYPRENVEEVVSGEYCECDNFSCDRYNGELCSGEDHGECICGNCKCKSEWDVEGYTACECQASNNTCITPYGEHIGKLCSGHGECECGECKCEETEEGQYSGKYCEDCPTCPGKCEELKACVQCQVFNSGELFEQVDENGVDKCSLCPFKPEIVEKGEEEVKNDERLCTFIDDDDCRFTFVYGVWYAAVTQSFFSLGVGFGALTTYSSYNKFHHNSYKDALIISFADTFTSVLAGTVIFAILGHLSYELDLPVKYVVKSGAGLAFVSYPEVISKFNIAPQVFSVLFFLMLITLGFGSATGLISNVITVICDAFPGWQRCYVTAAISLAGLLVGLVYVTPGGQPLLELVDYYGGSLLVLTLALLEIIAIAWVYGASNVIKDPNMMLRTELGYYWKICWAVVIPTSLSLILAYAIYDYKPVSYDKIPLPLAAQIAGWVMTGLGVAMVPVFLILRACQNRDSSTSIFSSS